LAGLTVAYIQEQFEQYKNGNRRGARAISMIPVMKTITDDEIRAAAEYYAALKPVADWTDVVEAEMVTCQSDLYALCHRKCRRGAVGQPHHRTAEGAGAG
jgi:hypothetical protein